MADAAAGADGADDRQDDVFGCNPRGKFAFHIDRHPLWPRLWQGLGSEYMLYFAGADTKCQCPKCTMGGGVGVATDDRHSWQGASLFGADHVHDALAGIAHRKVGDAKLGGVAPQRVHLNCRDRICDRLIDIGSWHVVVLCGDGQIRTPNAAAGEAEPVKGLWTCDLVDQM